MGLSVSEQDQMIRASKHEEKNSFQFVQKWKKTPFAVAEYLEEANNSNTEQSDVLVNV